MLGDGAWTPTLRCIAHNW